ncbi:MAG: hypothetical protein ACRDRY_10380 [Pseudonocardiaceae bacterium]
MADQQQSEAAFGTQPGQLLHDRFGGLRVERGGDFVAQQDIGSAAMARAMATRCCCPPDSSGGYRSVKSFGNPT